MSCHVVFGQKWVISVLPRLPVLVPDPAGRVFTKCAGGVPGAIFTLLCTIREHTFLAQSSLFRSVAILHDG